MKKRSKKILSFILSLCVIATILPIQKISANSTFTLQLSKSKQMWFKIEGEHADFQKYEGTEISNVPFDKKITLKVEGIAADEDAKWTSIIGNDSDSIKVYEGEEETGPLKEISKVTTNTINFKMTETPGQTNTFPSQNGRKLYIQAGEKPRPYLNFAFNENYRKYLNGVDFKITDEIKKFDFSTFLQISTEIHSPEDNELRELEWKSEDTDVFTIKDGIFRPKKNGTSTITLEAIYNKDGHSLIPKDTVLKGKIKVIVAVPEKKLSIFNDYALLSLFKTKSVPVGAITKIEYTDVTDKTFLAWHGVDSISRELKIVDEQGQDTGKTVENLEPHEKTFYILMPNHEVKFAPSFEDLTAGRELKTLKNAHVKLITRFGKILSAPKQVQQADKLLKDDVIEVSDTKETINFNAWKYKGLELNENHSATTATTQFKVSGTDDIEIEAMYHPYANSESKTISGTKGEPLDATIKITLENMHFKNIAMGQDLSSWFVTPIAGLAYISNTAIEEANKVTELVIKISGTPTVTGTDTIVIKIPADSLSINTEKIINNPHLKYNIKEKFVAPPTPQLQPEQNSGSGSVSKVEKITKKEKSKTPKTSEKAEKTEKSMMEDKSIKVGDTAIEKVFEDIKQENWFAKSVAFVKERNLMSGVSENQFAPEQKTSRAMIVTILHRLAETPQVKQKSLFPDVKGDEYFAEALSWATSQNIVSGYPNGTFGSHDDVTREQLAVILYNYAKAMKFDIKSTADIKQFSDLDMVSNYAAEAINWANRTGIILGKENKIDPKGDVTRAEVAAMIMRFSELLKK